MPAAPSRATGEDVMFGINFIRKSLQYFSLPTRGALASYRVSERKKQPIQHAHFALARPSLRILFYPRPQAGGFLQLCLQCRRGLAPPPVPSPSPLAVRQCRSGGGGGGGDEGCDGTRLQEFFLNLPFDPLLPPPTLPRPAPAINTSSEISRGAWGGWGGWGSDGRGKGEE